jgi:prophage regulatory protein
MTEIDRGDRLVAFKEIRPLTGISYSKVYLLRLEKAGSFPRRIAIGPQRVYWSLAELRAWIDEKKATARGVAPQTAEKFNKDLAA